jgi:NAD(P)-dependent dehydrogenase (short-subunit alcohol dehydrogenase family)
MALTFAEAGSDIIVCARHTPALKQAAEEIEALGRRCLAFQADVGVKSDLDEMVSRAVKDFGFVDILVNNACNTECPASPMVELPEQDWDRVMDVNLKGYYLCSQAVGRLMLEKKKGSIINISSVSAIIPETPLGAYSVSKAGVSMLTRVLAVELAPHVRVNAIGPGFVRTGWTEHYWQEPGGLDEVQPWIDRAPLKRLAESSDIAATALFLASDASKAITGQIIYVDGGWLLV